MAAVALHGVVLLFLTASAKGTLFAGGNVVSDLGAPLVASVSLAGTSGVDGARRSKEDELQKLLRSLRSNEAPVVVETPKPDLKPSTSLEDLLESVDRAHARQAEAGGSGGRAKDDRGGKGMGANGAANANQSHRAEPSSAKPDITPGAAASSGSLWGQIEPCWSTLSERSTVVVTLEITLSPNGMIASPPKIIRPSAEAPSEMRLLSEARALEAVRACVPYRGADLGSNGRVFRVVFDKTK